MKRPHLLLILALGTVVAACGDDVPDTEAIEQPADTLTAQQQRARRDSAVAESGLPGAEGVRRAMDASEAASARARATDTLLP